MQQALGYAETLDVPFVVSSNGDAFLVHDRTGQHTPIEQQRSLDEFPSPESLWKRYCFWKGTLLVRLSLGSRFQSQYARQLRPVRSQFPETSF